MESWNNNGEANMKHMVMEIDVLVDDDVDEGDIEQAVNSEIGVVESNVEVLQCTSVNPSIKVCCHALGCSSEFDYTRDFIDEVSSIDDAAAYIQHHEESGWEVSEQPGITRGHFYCPQHAYHEPFVIQHS